MAKYTVTKNGHKGKKKQDNHVITFSQNIFPPSRFLLLRNLLSRNKYILILSALNVIYFFNDLIFS